MMPLVELYEHSDQDVGTDQRPVRHRDQRFKTLWSMATCLCLGLSAGYVGPCFLDLRDQVHVSVGRLSHIFLSHASGSLLGSIVGNGTSDSTWWVVWALLLLAISVAFVPWSKSLVMLAVMFSFQGLASGVLKTKYEDSCSSHVALTAVLQTAFGVGVTAGPVLVAILVNDGRSGITLTPTVPSDALLSSVLGNVSKYEVNQLSGSLSSSASRRRRSASNNISDSHLFQTPWNSSSSSKTPSNRSIEQSTESVLQISTTMSVTSPKNKPKKPAFSDGGKLSSDHNVADGSKYRSDIRNAIKEIHVNEDLEQPLLSSSTVGLPTTMIDAVESSPSLTLNGTNTVKEVNNMPQDELNVSSDASCLFSGAKKESNSSSRMKLCSNETEKLNETNISNTSSHSNTELFDNNNVTSVPNKSISIIDQLDATLQLTIASYQSLTTSIVSSSMQDLTIATHNGVDTSPTATFAGDNNSSMSNATTSTLSLSDPSTTLPTEVANDFATSVLNTVSLVVNASPSSGLPSSNTVSMESESSSEAYQPSTVGNLSRSAMEAFVATTTTPISTTTPTASTTSFSTTTPITAPISTTASTSTTSPTASTNVSVAMVSMTTTSSFNVAVSIVALPSTTQSPVSSTSPSSTPPTTHSAALYAALFTSRSSADIVNSSTGWTRSTSSSNHRHAQNSPIMVVYMVISGIVIGVNVLLIAAKIISLRLGYTRSYHAAVSTTRRSAVSRVGFSTAALFTIITILHFFHSGACSTFSGLMPTFVEVHLGWTRSAASSLAAAFWVSFTIGRLLGVCCLFTDCVRSWSMMFGGLTVGFLMAAALTLFVTQRTHGSLFLWSLSTTGTTLPVWVASMLFGFGMSVVTLASERHLPRVNHVKFAAIVGSCLGQMVVPVLSGLLSELYGLDWIINTIFATVAGALAVGLVMLCVAPADRRINANLQVRMLGASMETVFGTSKSGEDPEAGATDTNEEEDAELLSQNSKQLVEGHADDVKSYARVSHSSSLQTFMRIGSSAKKD